MMDVARRAGVSQTTVSLVLNDVPGVRISGAARARIAEAAEVLGYRLSARGTGQLRPIAYLADEFGTTPLSVLSLDGARDAAWEGSAILVAASGRGDAAAEAAILDLWQAQGITSLIYARAFTREVALPPALDAFDAVLLNCFTERPDKGTRPPSVVPAEQKGGASATRHLIAAGHRRIGFINGEIWMMAAQDRALGYRRALREAGLAYDPDLSRPGDWTATAGYAETRALMSLGDPPTAIFCANDPMAEGCYAALKDLGRSVPEDVSVVGYDNRSTAQHMRPQLTSCELPHVEMGRWAAQRLLGRGSGHGGRVRLDCPLIERASVAPPPAARRATPLRLAEPA